MAKRGALTHRKTRRLASRLGIEIPYALGLREALWHVTAEQSRAGDIGRMCNADIAAEMFYGGDPEELIAGLIDAGIIDRDEEHRLVTHGWSEHADDAVHMALARAREFFADGSTPRFSRLPGRERAAAEAFYAANCAHGVRTACTRCAHGVRTAAAAGCPPEPRQSPARANIPDSLATAREAPAPADPTPDIEPEGVDWQPGLMLVRGQLQPPPADLPLARPSRPLPADWQPSQEHAEIAADAGLVLADETALFRAHFESQPKSSANWGAEFTKWLTRSKVMARNALAASRASPKRRGGYESRVERQARIDREFMHGDREDREAIDITPRAAV